MRWGEIDIREMVAVPRWVSTIVFAGVCTLAFVAVRTLIDLGFPGAGPFALAFPAILVATLFAGPVSGGITLLFTVLWGWYYGLPPIGSFAFENPADQPRLIINALAGGLILLVTDGFRRSAREARDLREKQVAERTLFLREIEHRVANNFATIGALLRLQLKQAPDGYESETLQALLARVEGLARSHRYLYSAGDFTENVAMRPYLEALCASLSEGMLANSSVKLTCRCDPIEAPRDRAVVIGIIINEVVTNAFKHAFTESGGVIHVSLESTASGLLLNVGDNGKGLSGVAREGLGRRLLEDLVRQAAGRTDIASKLGEGVRYSIEFGPIP